MEAKEVSTVAGGGGGRYTSPINNEDILFCVDADAESLVEMKTTGADGKPFTRLDAIKSPILLFINAELTVNPDHRFAFATLSKSVAWRKKFSGSVESAVSAIRMLLATSPSSGQADLTNLFRIAAHEAKKSRAQNRILRVILLYCRSSTRPQHQWPVNQKLFTLDVMYLHDKPGPDNCPQAVYDALVEALGHVTEHEGYIYESGQGLARTLFRYISVMLAHPQQRCPQEYMDTVCPKSLIKKAPPLPLPLSEPGNVDETIPVPSQ